MVKRFFYSIILLTVASLVLLPSSRSETKRDGMKKNEKGEIVIRLGMLPIIDNLPFWVAQKKGYFKDEGMAAELIFFPSAVERDSAFTALTRELMQDVLQNILQTRGLTVMLVTHSIEEAAFLGRRIIVLTGHPGSVYRIFDNPRAGSPDYRKSDDFFHLCTQLRGGDGDCAVCLLSLIGGVSAVHNPDKRIYQSFRCADLA